MLTTLEHSKVLTMTLNEITKQLLDIANEIENNTMFDNHLGAQKKRAAVNRLTPICQTLVSHVTKNCKPSKSQLKLILRALDEISKEYQINELNEPIKNLKAYLKSLG